MKTKFMIVGKLEISKLFFNFVDLAEVNDHTNLGDAISAPRFPRKDPFKKMYRSLCDQAEKVNFAMKIKSNLLRIYPMICCQTSVT